MRETPEAFEARVGLRYDPPAGLRSAGQALQPGEPCPTLFRFPGAAALHDHLVGRALTRWGPPGGGWLWLTEVPSRARRQAATTFGVLAALEPLRMQPCRHASGAAGRWLAVDVAPEGEQAVWLPPSFVRRPVGLEDVGTREQALALLGPQAWEDARERAVEHLGAYLEELSVLERAGAAGPSLPWMDVPAAERRRVLAEYGVTPRWTGRRRSQ